MRKALSLALVAMATMLFVLTSCASSSKKASYTEEECNYTLTLVLRQATDQAIPQMLLGMNGYHDSMVMEDYSFLNDLRQTIPGMDRLLGNWEETVVTSVNQFFDLFSAYLEAMVDGIEFSDPVQMVSSSLWSISDYILETEGPGMSNVVKDHLSGLDVSPWREVAVQYNSWASTRNKLYGETSPMIDANMDSDQIIIKLSRHLVEVYISYLQGAEVLIRTTPNADMDPVAARVLGLE